MCFSQEFRFLWVTRLYRLQLFLFLKAWLFIFNQCKTNDQVISCLKQHTFIRSDFFRSDSSISYAYLAQCTTTENKVQRGLYYQMEVLGNSSPSLSQRWTSYPCIASNVSDYILCHQLEKTAFKERKQLGDAHPCNFHLKVNLCCRTYSNHRINIHQSHKLKA